MNFREGGVRQARRLSYAQVTLALTLTFSPGERGQRLGGLGLFGDLVAISGSRCRVRRWMILPLLGERVGVRAVQNTNLFQLFLDEHRISLPLAATVEHLTLALADVAGALGIRVQTT